MAFQFNLGTTAAATEDRGQLIPTTILEQDLISGTSEAHLCFTQQEFSAKLQAYMINYVISTTSLYSVYS